MYGFNKELTEEMELSAPTSGRQPSRSTV